MRKDIPDTICGTCKRSAGKCSWSAKFVPIEGWKAIPTKIAIGNKFDDSYAVLYCPKYVENYRRKEKYKYTFRKGSEEKVCVGRAETEAFIGVHESYVKRAARGGHTIHGYEVKMCLV